MQGLGQYLDLLLKDLIPQRTDSTLFIGTPKLGRLNSLVIMLSGAVPASNLSYSQ